MPKIDHPHGKTHVKRFVGDLQSRFGLAVLVIDESGKACDPEDTLASLRDPHCRGCDVEFELDHTVAALQSQIQSCFGLRIVVLGVHGESVPGQSQLGSIQIRSADPITQTSERERADQISIIGQKLISTVQSEFTEHHPFLGLILFSTEEHDKSLRGIPARPLASDQTIASVREKKSMDELSIHGNMVVRNLETLIREVYGLYAQVCIMNDAGKKAYTGDSHDGYTLSQLNRRQQEKGRLKFRYS